MQTVRSTTRSAAAATTLALLALSPGASAGDPVLVGLAHPSAPGTAITGLDVDQDGRPDLVLAVHDQLQGQLALSWLPGRGDGSFAPPAPLAQELSVSPFGFLALESVDADGDGLTDLVVVASPDPLVLAALPGGGLGPASPFDGDGLLVPVASADLDGNGLVDGVDVVTVGSIIGGTAHPVLRVTLDLGAGATEELLIEPVQWFEQYGEVVPGDLDGDGLVDLVVRASYGGQQLRVYRGRGDGTFDPPAAIASELALADLALLDADHDGDLDLLAATSLGDPPQAAVALHAGQGDGGFGPAMLIPVAGSPSGVIELAVGDVDGDGLADLLAQAVAVPFGEPPPVVSLFAGLPEGGFGAERVFGLEGHTAGQRVLDADGDGRLDLVRVGWVELPDPEGRTWVHRGGDGPVVSLGGGVDGGPALTVGGTPAPGALVTVAAADAPAPGSSTWLLVSPNGLWQPLAGGLLGPQAALLAPLDAPVAGRWPQLPDGVPLFVQGLRVDGAGLHPGDALALVTTP